ncbi:uncharacterized protein TRAVEDRAFT_23899 [Trametes versicolor FP-101664 SS1]|uniref:uncharacterized protein n=1 Tax=Trametes versicolor (strain FP-101664) TaxID=717944 RepID=UPI0004623836|nr:uncharacterized protein TRAVEDRAFT_23899 [Trametes versicolor FP-101664 SS1]EIW53614.1 hypothetical protein TRAVEDRAFT_23899 [Trametes versicolor FP-101664 SS1]
MPPKFRKVRSPRLDAASDDTSDSDDAAGSEDKSSVQEESGEAENTDDEDEGLEVMEKNPQALKKMFADETAHWVGEDEDEPASEPPNPPESRSKPSKSKKRSRHQNGGSESEAVIAPPTKKQSRNGSKEAIGTVTKSKPKPAPDRAAIKETPKRAVSSKRADEIPKFRKPNESNNLVRDADSETPKLKAKGSKTHPKSSKLLPGKYTSHTDSDTGSDVDDVSSTDSDSVDSGIEIVYPQRGKLKLKEQHRRVRRIIQHGINTMLADVLLKNAFPDGPERQGQIVKRALLSAASHFAYDDISRRLRKQEDYADDLCRIPAQRIPTFRGQVRKLVEGQPCTAFGLVFGDKDKGDWLQEGFRYIYPFDYQNKTINVGKPYSPPVFLETLRVAFFKRPSSLGFKISEHFESSLPDKPDEKEIPAAMLALVATALHAAIEDCKHNRVQPRDFSSNDYWGVYKDHIQELSTIRTHGPVQFHVLMHGFWRRISTPMGTSGPSGGPRKSFLNVAAMEVE